MQKKLLMALVLLGLIIAGFAYYQYTKPILLPPADNMPFAPDESIREIL